MVKLQCVWGNRLVRNTCAGLVHPRVLEYAGVDPNRYSGFAFGVGVDRMAMLKYGINDIRLLYEGDVSFLRSL